ncbi:MAG: glycosyltransferase family 4 protein [Nitriliruptoraceae bacterium]
MRVAMVCPYDIDVPGGVQQHVRRLTAELSLAGADVRIVAAGTPGSEDGIVRVGRSIGVRFNGSVAPLALGWRVSARVARALADFGPDVVHVHEPIVPHVGPAAVRAARDAGVAVVGTFHAYSARARLAGLARRWGRRTVAGVDTRIAVSRAAAGFHAGLHGFDVSDLVVIGNGVDVDRLSAPRPPAELTVDDLVGGDGGEITVLFVGRLERRKGLATLVRAFVRVRHERTGIRLVVVGDGSQLRRCARLVPEALDGDVEFLGRVDNDELVRVHERADLFVSPALGGESFGIVLLEAMAAGTAVIASDLPGYREVLDDGHCGVLVPPGDHGALARAILRLASDPMERRHLVDVSREHVRGFDWPVVTRRVRDEYERTARSRT